MTPGIYKQACRVVSDDSNATTCSVQRVDGPADVAWRKCYQGRDACKGEDGRPLFSLESLVMLQQDSTRRSVRKMHSDRAAPRWQRAESVEWDESKEEVQTWGA